MAMEFSFRKAEHAARLLVPQILLIVLLLLNMASLPLPYADSIKTHFVLMAIYYWAIYRPTLIPPSLCFLIGLLMDVMGGFALGLNAMVLVIVQWLVRDQRKFLMGQPYIVIWAVFGLVALCSTLLQWALNGLSNGMQWPEPMPVIAGTMVSLFLFPLVTLVLVMAHRMLPTPSRSIQ